MMQDNIDAVRDGKRIAAGQSLLITIARPALLLLLCSMCMVLFFANAPIHSRLSRTGEETLIVLLALSAGMTFSLEEIVSCIVLSVRAIKEQ